jgi:hypothetical protein
MLMGKGFAFWNTMPIRLRIQVTSTLRRVYVPARRSRTSPSMRTPGTRSFMRLSVLRKVDFPQPEGPISAVMRWSGISR